jgi:2-polyprenyl-6-methoxyphenol hydroxylase-like FAD-dependent oxidoreductase
MEQTDVVIVGAGPSGLALGLTLARRKVKVCFCFSLTSASHTDTALKTIILESNKDICEDPRAIAISGDTSRILNILGLDYQTILEFGQREGKTHWMRHSVYRLGWDWLT